MQRVAIARALVNDPDILLADEPTGALDSETSLQIMELIKEIASDRLVIMVTHNPELAEKYSTRIVKLIDGKIISDSDPFDGNAPKEKKTEVQKGKKTSMSFATALSLSKNNLLTKKGRTFLTSFAGSIGIIGIALILSLSNGVKEYIDSVEHSTLSSYPISIQQETMDYGSLMSSMMGIREDQKAERDPNLIYTNDISTEMVKTMLSEMTTNNLAQFKEYLESNPENILDSISEIQYSYSPNLYIYGHDLNEDLIQINPSTVMQAMMGDSAGSSIASMADTYSSMMGSAGNPYDVWTELLSNNAIEEQYAVIAGRLPESYNEVVFIVNENHELSDVTLYALGLRDQDEIAGMMEKISVGESFDLETGDLTFTHDELMGLEFRLLTAPDFYEENEDGIWIDMRDDVEYMEKKLESAPEIKVVGIIKPSGDSLLSSAGQSGGIGYTHALTEFMIDRVNSSEIVKAQRDNDTIDIFTGVEFPVEDDSMTPRERVNEYIASLSDEEAMAMMTQMAKPEDMAAMSEQIMATLTPEQMMQLQQVPADQMQSALLGMVETKQLMEMMMAGIPDDQIKLLEKYLPKTDATLEGNLEALGVADLAKPSEIKIYAKDFDSKERITDLITKYNDEKTNEDKKEDMIRYTDYVGLMISSVSDIIDSISYILIAFVAISLVVSSIMIGIITYISVLERTKEIGILRSIGASTRDISRVFNAETLIVGFVAGAIGIIVTIILIFPINAIIEAITDIAGMAVLPWQGGIILVLISMLLTLIAGLFPAQVAAKKDPVVALRTE